MDKLNIFRTMWSNSIKINDWVNSIPSEINKAFLDNTMTQLLFDEVNMLAAEVFTEEQFECVEWFINDWGGDNSLCWQIDEQTYKFKNIEEFIDLLVSLEIFEESRKPH